MRILKLLLLYTLINTGSAFANNHSPHLLISEFLGKVDNLKPGQHLSIFDLQKAETEMIQKLKQIAISEPKSFLETDKEGKTVAMRLAHAGLINTLSEVIKIPAVNRSLRNTRDLRGFSTADQVTTAPFRTSRVCKNKDSNNLLPDTLWSGYTTILKSYEKILSAFVNKVPTNPRTVATIWLKECPDADQSVRIVMAKLAKENSSKKIQAYLLQEDLKFSNQLFKQEQEEAIAKSEPKLNTQTATKLNAAQTRKIGPIEVANNPNGDGVLIAKIHGDRTKFKADTNDRLDIYASIGHRVTHIEYIQLGSLADVDKAINEFREKKIKNLSLTLYVGKSYGINVVDINIPFK